MKKQYEEQAEKYYCDCAYYFYDRSDRWDFQNS